MPSDPTPPKDPLAVSPAPVSGEPAVGAAQADAGAPAQEGEPGQAAPASEQHWLFRLTAEQWLDAADNELRGAQTALLGKHQRTGVTHARRAAGMAINAVLRLAPDDAYGRSYMDHLQALHRDPAQSAELREAAHRLLTVPITPQLVTLGPKGDTKPADFAARIFAYARDFVAQSRPPAISDGSSAS